MVTLPQPVPMLDLHLWLKKYFLVPKLKIPRQKAEAVPSCYINCAGEEPNASCNLLPGGCTGP